MCSSIKFLDRYCRGFHVTDLKIAAVVAAQQRQPLRMSAGSGLGHTFTLLLITAVRESYPADCIRIMYGYGRKKFPLWLKQPFRCFV